MRITGGQAKGIPLKTPHGDLVRPATDGMRQAVFSTLAALIPQAQVLDLFAGSGSYGLEALSRGAGFCTFVEKSPKALTCLRQNLVSVSKALGRAPNDCGHLIASDVTSVSAVPGTVPNLVFIDPPYEIIEELAGVLFEKLSLLLEADPDPVILFEMPGEIELGPKGWTCVKRLGKGRRQPSVCFFKRA